MSDRQFILGVSMVTPHHELWVLVINVASHCRLWVDFIKVMPNQQLWFDLTMVMPKQQLWSDVTMVTPYRGSGLTLTRHCPIKSSELTLPRDHIRLDSGFTLPWLCPINNHRTPLWLTVGWHYHGNIRQEKTREQYSKFLNRNLNVMVEMQCTPYSRKSLL